MSITPLNEDLDVIQNLVIPFLEEDMDNIQKLDDEPNDVGGLSAAELKYEFDRAGNIIKSYINETLVPKLSGTVAEEEERAAAEAERKAAEEERKKTFSSVLAIAEECRDTAVASAETAVESAETSVEMASDSEAWAVGTRSGVAVPETDLTYRNNAKYWAENAKEIVGPVVTPTEFEETITPIKEDISDIKEDISGIQIKTETTFQKLMTGRFI